MENKDDTGDLGPWDTAHEARFLDLTSKIICKRIKYFYRRNHPCDDAISDVTVSGDSVSTEGVRKQSTRHLAVYHCPSFSMREMQQLYPHPGSRRNPPNDQNEISRLEATCEMRDCRNTVWYDADGEKLVHYFPHFLNRIVQAKVSQAFRDLIAEYKPTKPPESEQRSTRYEEWKARLGEDAKSGVIRLTYHHQRGEAHTNPVRPAADFLGRSVQKTVAALQFRKSEVMQNIADWVSILFAAIDPPTWRRYREVYQLSAAEFPLLQECDRNDIQCFIGQYLVINMLTTPHYDVKDPPKGWVAMVIVGDYIDGHLFIPQLGIRLPYKSGDIVFIRSWMLLHFINEYSGPERFVVVFSTTYSIFEWLQRRF